MSPTAEIKNKTRLALEAWEAAPGDDVSTSHSEWKPFVDSPQERAYYSKADILFYGGAAGGGKTDLLLGLAGTAHRKSVIFRRVFPQLRSIVERSREIYNPTAMSHARDSYNESLHIWRLHADRLVEFGSLQYEKDKQQQQGRPRDFYGFDEVTEFTESQVRFVISWNRSAIMDQRCRVVLTGNPPMNPEGLWVVQMFAPWLDKLHPKYPAVDGDLLWCIRHESRDVWVDGPDPVEIDGKVYHPHSRTFIKALLSDNPVLAGTGYEAMLDQMDEPFRSMLREGRFDLSLEDHAWQLFPTWWIDLAQSRWEKTPKPGSRLDALGVDVARGGADKFVIAKRHGLWIDTLIEKLGKEVRDGQTAAALVSKEIAGDPTINVDVGGVGASAFDFLKMTEKNVHDIDFGGKADGTDKSERYHFENVRAAMYWRLHELMDGEHGDGVCLPPGQGLKSDLAAIRYEIRLGKIKIESKDDIKKRLGRSTDYADAVALAFWEPPDGYIYPSVFV